MKTNLIATVLLSVIGLLLVLVTCSLSFATN